MNGIIELVKVIIRPGLVRITNGYNFFDGHMRLVDGTYHYN